METTQLHVQMVLSELMMQIMFCVTFMCAQKKNFKIVLQKLNLQLVALFFFCLISGPSGICSSSECCIERILYKTVGGYDYATFEEAKFACEDYNPDYTICTWHQVKGYALA